MAGIILKLTEMMNDLPVSERKAAQYISENLDSMVGLSIKELSVLSGSSEAAIVRFCKSLGCKGYRDFSIQLATALAVNQSTADKDAYSDIREGDDVESTVRNVFYHNIQALEDTFSLIDPKLVAQVAEALFEAKRIDFYGIGASNFVAQDAQYKFMRINKPATAYSDPHMQLASAANLTSEDAVVAISWSGETREVLDAARLAKKNGALVVAITHCGRTTLGECADVNFGLSAPEVFIRCGAMSSRVAQLTVIDALFSYIFSQHYHEVRVCLDRTRRGSDQDKDGVFDRKTVKKT